MRSADFLFGFRAIQRIARDVGFLCAAMRCFGEKYAFICGAVDHTLELFAHANRPIHRIGMDLQHIFHFIHQIKRIASGHVHFVDEGEHRDFSQTATSKSLRVCFSTPLEASITMMAQSAAVSVR